MESARLARLKAELADARAEIRDKDEELAVLDIELRKNLRLVEAAPDTAAARRPGQAGASLEDIASALRTEVQRHGERFTCQLAGLSAGARALAGQLAHEHEERLASVAQIRQDIAEWRAVTSSSASVGGGGAAAAALDGAQKALRGDLHMQRQQQEAQGAEIARIRQGVDALAQQAASKDESAWLQTVGATETLGETCARLSIEISALGARLDVVAGEASDVQEEVRQHREEVQADFKAWGDIAASRMAELAASVDDVRTAWAHEAASLRVAIESGTLHGPVAAAAPPPSDNDADSFRALLDAMRGELQDVARELATERVARYAAVEELFRSIQGQSSNRAGTGADGAPRCEYEHNGEALANGPTPAMSAYAENMEQICAHGLVDSVRNIEKEVPLLAKAIVSGSQELAVRLQEERSVRRAAEVVHESRIKQIERQVHDLVNSIGPCPKFNIGTPDLDAPTCGAGATPKRGAKDDSLEAHEVDAAEASGGGTLPAGTLPGVAARNGAADPKSKDGSGGDAPISPRCLSAELGHSPGPVVQFVQHSQREHGAAGASAHAGHTRPFQPRLGADEGACDPTAQIGAARNSSPRAPSAKPARPSQVQRRDAAMPAGPPY